MAQVTDSAIRAGARRLLETEEPRYIEVRHRVGPEKAAYLLSRFPNFDPRSYNAMSIGSRRYEYGANGWEEIRKRPNPKWKPGVVYNLVYGDGLEPFYGLILKMPETLTSGTFRKALRQIVRDAVGKPAGRLQTDAVEGFTKDKRFAKYEVFLDGTWERR